MFLRAAGARRARSRIWTLDGHRTDTVWEWGCAGRTPDGHCVGVGVCFWLCGCAGVFWLCGGAGVFLAVWVCGCAGVLGVSVGDWVCLGVSYFSYSFSDISRTSAGHGDH